MIKISVITINYNNAEGLARTVKSVVDQDYCNIDYIVIDGGSTDASAAIIAANSAHISYTVSEKDKGVYDAQNKGLAKATGEYVLVLNAGDELADETVLKRVFASGQQADIVYGNMIIVHPDGRRENGRMPSQMDMNHMMSDTLWHPVSFVKKSFLDKVGFYDTSYKIVADYDWFLRAIFKHKATLHYINTNISVFYLGGLSSLPENAAKIKEERMRSQTAVFGEEPVKQWYASQPVPSRSLFSRILNRLRSS